MAYTSFSLIYPNLISRLPLSLIFLGIDILEELHIFNFRWKKPKRPLRGMQGYARELLHILF